VGMIMSMNPRSRQWIVFFGMAALIIATGLASKSTSPKAAVLSLCTWNAVFILSGVFCVIWPVGWLHFMGTPADKPVSRATKIAVRCFGGFMLAVGGMMAINMIVNFKEYWSGLY
jgi:hypothetical protein